MSISHNDMRRINYDLLLLEYAAGTLDLAQSLIVRTHLSLSPQGQARTRMCESIGSALLQSCEPVAMRDDSLSRVLDMLDAPPRPAPPPRPSHEDMMHMVLELAGCIEDELKWRRLYRGLKTCDIPLRCQSSLARFMELSPAAQTPRHTHKGLEITLVLGGAFHDEQQLYEYGDLIVMGEEDTHMPQACDRQGCFSMVVTGGPVRLTGWARLLNPFIKF